MSVFYLPKNGVCGDFIPYYNHERKCYELYYLHDYRGLGGEPEGTDWKRITTDDMVHFTEEGVMIPRRTCEDQDFFCYTGCVVEHEGICHIFYTGDNYRFQQAGKKREAVMHAVSENGRDWQKVPEDTFYAPDGNKELEQDDWRDPFVFFNEEQGKWWMLLCTRKKTGPSRRRGATGLLTSDDLAHWTYEGDFWNPHSCWCPECPDLFSWGDYWYLVYSTFSETEGLRTYYRISDSINGPWKNPGNNCFDGRAFYAGKTASDGNERYLFGWNPTKTGNADDGIWQWGGNLVVHKLAQNEDGTLTVSAPDLLLAGFDEEEIPKMRVPGGTEMAEARGELHLTASSGMVCAFTEEIPDPCMIEFEVKLLEDTDSAGIMVHASEEGASGYYIRLEPGRGRFLFDREPSHTHELVEISRFVKIEKEVWHKVRVIMEDTCLLAYLDDKYALSARMYDFKGKDLLFFVNDGSAKWRNIRIRKWKND